ncbi:MAG: hypothetical protein NXI20_27090 [bacterium]|nr:hypothetical protein [bacterium]
MSSFLKYITLILLTSSCVMLGKHTIHSPQAENAQPIRTRHTHGGATKNSPPDICRLFIPRDSISIVVGAEHIYTKTNWGGLGIPILPAFLIPKIDNYKNKPNTLTVLLILETKDTVLVKTNDIKIQLQDTLLTPASTRLSYSIDSIVQVPENFELVENPEYYDDPFLIRYHSNLIYLDFPVTASSVQHFELKIGGLIINNRKLKIPNISFIKTKQRFTFVGP